ncbi:MAG: hypothetical protein COU11_01120 [Candidatus Harrisonbacteria bacterium CG10_big_fil_rev_8_21_14_0_10_49_15]|uniref:Septum formation initiator n=1 Tax=Candidatus Harrisonbacteria bacterium CG10_big_fil_rev_8_21_14_0_10_49_15 TaxID=1974587 RepID=A0A2H0ULR6_9BACT|nr:MAG: hypothetical protein COU11_01120 [Candidatus Harrisonbacteria bacterium CG10_big_fil_rev_8_21_14_0_10_49_15]
MKFFFGLFFLAILGFLATQLYSLRTHTATYNDQLGEFGAEASLLQAENRQLRQDLQYYSQDENLAKELRAQFNYRAPDEKLFILVSPQGDE